MTGEKRVVGKCKAAAVAKAKTNSSARTETGALKGLKEVSSAWALVQMRRRPQLFRSRGAATLWFDGDNEEEAAHRSLKYQERRARREKLRRGFFASNGASSAVQRVHVIVTDNLA